MFLIILKQFLYNCFNLFLISYSYAIHFSSSFTVAASSFPAVASSFPGVASSFPVAYTFSSFADYTFGFPVAFYKLDSYKIGGAFVKSF